MWKNFFRGEHISTRANKVLTFLICIYFVGAFLAMFDVFSRHTGHSPVVSNIISGLRSMKSAALMLRDDCPEPLPEGVNHIALLVSYLDNPERYTNDRHAYIVSGDAHWCGYRLNSSVDRRRGENPRNGLARRAKSVGVYGSLSINVPPVSSDEEHIYSESHNAAWIRAF